MWIIAIDVVVRYIAVICLLVCIQHCYVCCDVTAVDDV